MNPDAGPPRFNFKAAAFLCAAGLLFCLGDVVYQSVAAARLRSGILLLLSEEAQLTHEKHLAFLKDLEEELQYRQAGLYHHKSDYSIAEKARRDKRISELRQESGRLRADRYSRLTRSKWMAGFGGLFLLATTGFAWWHRRQPGVIAPRSDL